MKKTTSWKVVQVVELQDSAMQLDPYPSNDGIELQYEKERMKA